MSAYQSEYRKQRRKGYKREIAKIIVEWMNEGELPF